MAGVGMEGNRAVKDRNNPGFGTGGFQVEGFFTIAQTEGVTIPFASMRTSTLSLRVKTSSPAELAEPRFSVGLDSAQPESRMTMIAGATMVIRSA